MMTTFDNRHRLQGIDLLRGFASLWVVLSHYIPHWNDTIAPTLVIVPREYGRFAVYLFFAISGFVIFMTLDRCKTVTDFVVLRFSRLYPAYWATLLFATAISVAVFGARFWSGGFIVNLTMLQEFLRYPNFDVAYWSLTAELAFYLNAAWLFALGWHRRV
ncbi:MAG TPA: acyltransferase, partial [Steroidobacteraceae bacterium]|nr:acyltransferase [Steroidobacteraceae bacterium]